MKKNRIWTAGCVKILNDDSNNEVGLVTPTSHCDDHSESPGQGINASDQFPLICIFPSKQTTPTQKIFRSFSYFGLLYYGVCVTAKPKTPFET